MNHEDYKAMIPARALSALDATEDRMLSQHLVECAECTRELQDWQATAGTLALSAEPAKPSPQVRERILSQIHEGQVSTSTANVLPFTTLQKNLWTSFGSLGTIAATLVFAALIVYVVLLWRENRAIQMELAVLRAEAHKSQRELDQKTKLVAMFEKPGTRFSELTGMPVAPTATAKLVYDTSGHAMIMTQGLPAPPAGKEYQLWFIVGNKPTPGKTFGTDNQGRGVMEDQIPPEAMNSAVFAITLERIGGVRLPEGAMYLKS